MQRNDLEELGQETDAEKYLSWSRHAPVQKIYQRHYSICLKHIVSIFSQTAKD
jgi:hypothetical protein